MNAIARILLIVGCIASNASFAQIGADNEFFLEISNVTTSGNCDYAFINFTFTMEPSICLDANDDVQVYFQFPSGSGWEAVYTWNWFEPGTHDYGIAVPYISSPTYVSGLLLVTGVLADGTPGPNCSAEDAVNVSQAGIVDEDWGDPYVLNWDLEIQPYFNQAACGGASDGIFAFNTVVEIGQYDAFIDPSENWTLFPHPEGVELGTTLYSGPDGEWPYAYLSGLPPGDYALTLDYDPGENSYLPCGNSTSHFFTIEQQVPALSQIHNLSEAPTCETPVQSLRFALETAFPDGSEWLPWNDWTLTPEVEGVTWTTLEEQLDDQTQYMLVLDGLPAGNYTLQAETTDAVPSGWPTLCASDATLDFTYAPIAPPSPPLVTGGLEPVCADGYHLDYTVGSVSDFSLEDASLTAVNASYTVSLSAILDQNGAFQLPPLLPSETYVLELQSIFGCAHTYTFNTPDVTYSQIHNLSEAPSCETPSPSLRFALETVFPNGSAWLPWNDWTLTPEVEGVTWTTLEEQVDDQTQYMLVLDGLPAGNYTLVAETTDAVPSDWPPLCGSDATLDFTYTPIETPSSPVISGGFEPLCTNSHYFDYTVGSVSDFSLDDASLTAVNASFTVSLNAILDENGTFQLPPLLPSEIYILEMQSTFGCAYTYLFGTPDPSNSPDDPIITGGFEPVCTDGSHFDYTVGSVSDFSLVDASLTAVNASYTVSLSAILDENGAFQLPPLLPSETYVLALQSIFGCEHTYTFDTPDATYSPNDVVWEVVAPGWEDQPGIVALEFPLSEPGTWTASWEGQEVSLPGQLSLPLGTSEVTVSSEFCALSVSVEVFSAGVLGDLPTTLLTGNMGTMWHPHALSGNGEYLFAQTAAATGMAVYHWEDGWVLETTVPIDPADAILVSGIASNHAGDKVVLSGWSLSEGGKALTLILENDEWVVSENPLVHEVPVGYLNGSGFGSGIDLTPDGNTLVLNTPNEIYPIAQVWGRVHVFDWVDTHWSPRGSSILHIGGGSQIEFGNSLSISDDGNRLSIGSPGDGSNSLQGQVNTYDWTGTFWLESTPRIYGEDGDRLGWDVQLSGNGAYLAVGAPGEADDALGKSMVYAFADGNWELGHTLVGETPGQHEGYLVGLDQSGTLWTSCNEKGTEANGNQITVRLVQRSCADWTESSEVISSGPTEFNSAGFVMSDAGDRLVLIDKGADVIVTTQYYPIPFNTSLTLPELEAVEIGCGDPPPAPPEAQTSCGDPVIAVLANPEALITFGNGILDWNYFQNDLLIATQEQAIHVLDADAPVPVLDALPDAIDNCNIQAPIALDACEGELEATTNDQLYYQEPGTYAVTWNFTDAAGNYAMQEQTIVVTTPCNPVVACPADVSGDGVVSANDLLAVLGAFGCSTLCEADLDGDAVVSASDLLIVLGGFGDACDYE